MRKAVPEQGSYLLDMKHDLEEDFTYALLEWKEDVPAEFKKGMVSLAGGLDGHVIPVHLPEEAT